MTNKELVNQISGLNSTSTLKNWIQLIKEISGKEFKKIKIPISRNPRTHQLREIQCVDKRSYLEVKRFAN